MKEGNVRQLCEHMDAQLNCMTLDLGGGGGGGGGMYISPHINSVHKTNVHEAIVNLAAD